uniref:Bestrophin homolog n=1 Tax=Syphacia muris TaxID=451379 RepID=A0A0N5AWN1_9BILA
MTISYNYDVCSASATAFICLLFRWRGSIWKCVIKELLVWTIFYLLIAFFYRTPYFLNKSQKIYNKELLYT